MIQKRVFVLCLILLLASLVGHGMAQSPDDPQTPLAYFLYNAKTNAPTDYVGVWRFNPQTRQARRLASAPPSSFIDDLQWSPSAQALSYIADAGMVVLGTDGANQRTLIPDAMMYNWAPDNQSATYVKYDFETRHYTVYSREVDDPVEHLLIRDASWPAWSPDGTTLAYAAPIGTTLSLFHAGTSTTILEGIKEFRGEMERIRWSPDGTKLAFDVVELMPGETRTNNFFLYTINADGSGLTQVANDIRRPEMNDFTWVYFGWTPFDWSPDSTTLVYSSGLETAGLYTVKADGTDRQTLIKGDVQENGQSVPGQFFEFQALDWSPDGSWIAFSAKRYPSFDIFIIRPDGTDLRPLITSEKDELGVVWRPDTP